MREDREDISAIFEQTVFGSPIMSLHHPTIGRLCFVTLTPWGRTAKASSLHELIKRLDRYQGLCQKSAVFYRAVRELSCARGHREAGHDPHRS